MVAQNQVRDFFARAEWLDYVVLRQLDHIRDNWEITWDENAKRYRSEENSFSHLLNCLIDELTHVVPPTRYHDHEDRLAEYVRDGRLKWPIRNVGMRWEGAEYKVILEQGGFNDVDQSELVRAASGRVWAAIKRSQLHFDDMEQSHQQMLGAVLSIVLYHRAYF
jgi:hypothetical protein